VSFQAVQRSENVVIREAPVMIMNERFRLGFGHRNGHVGTAPRTSKHDVNGSMLVVDVADI
jgi:hypothetical protein